LGNYGHRDGKGVRRHAGVRIAGLVAKASLKKMLARLCSQVGMQDELTGINAELLPGRKLQSIFCTRREVDRCDIETLHLDHREPRRNQGLVRRGVRVDVQSIGHAKVKVDLGCVAGGNVYPIGEKELHRRRCIASLIAAARQRQGLVFYHLPVPAKQNKPGDKHGSEAEHLFTPGGQCLLDAVLDFSL
jgi:hypothetical protein